MESNDILQRVKRLWKALESTKPDGPEYKALMEQIRISSVKDKVLIEASQRAKASK